MNSFSRRQLLASGIAIGGSLMTRAAWPQGTPQLPPEAASVGFGKEEPDYDWDASVRHGYDPSQPEPERSLPGHHFLEAKKQLPVSAVVDPRFLPPVGTQGHAESC